MDWTSKTMIYCYIGIWVLGLCILCCYIRSIIKWKNEKIEHLEKEIKELKDKFEGLSKWFKQNQALKESVEGKLNETKQKLEEAERLLKWNIYGRIWKLWLWGTVGIMLWALVKKEWIFDSIHLFFSTLNEIWNFLSHFTK